MEAKERSFLFMSTASYYDIPFFQRAYVWDEENWSELLNNFLDHTDSHFLGSIILKQEPTKSGEPSRYMVIDGQQRLTTLSILLRACYDRLMETQDKYSQKIVDGFLTDLESLLFIKANKFSETADVKIYHSKLDKSAYQDVINGVYSDYAFREADPRYKKSNLSRIIRCYFYFRDELHAKEEDEIQSIWNLLTTDTNKFLVNIDLGANENEQKIFDTVNSYGVRLSSSDTIKNSVFQRYIDILRDLKETDVDIIASKLHDETWERAFSPDDEVSAYWESTRRYGRLTRDNTEVFLHSFAVINGFFDPASDNIVTLPQKYKEEISGMERKELESFLELLREYAGVYRRYFNVFNSDTTYSFSDYRLRLLHLCHALDVATFHPYILKLLYMNEISKELPTDEMKELLLQLERYIVLNAICGGSTKNYNNECVQLVRERKNPRELQTESSDINRKTFNDGLRNMRVNKIPTAILFWVELFDRATKYSDITDLKYNFTLEHIMPQKWRDNWSTETLPVYSERGYVVTDSRDAAEIRTEHVYQIGNMTLLNSKLNTALSNNTFDKKVHGDGNKYKHTMSSLADLYLTREVIKNDSWDERNIRQRTAEMQDKIEKLWKIEFPEDKPVHLDVDYSNLRDSYETIFADDYFTDIYESIKKSDLSEDNKKKFTEYLLDDIYDYYYYNNKLLYDNPDKILERYDREILEDVYQTNNSPFIGALLAADDGDVDGCINHYIDLFKDSIDEKRFCKSVLLPVKNAMPGFYKKLLGIAEKIPMDDMIKDFLPVLDKYYKSEDHEDDIRILSQFLDDYPDSVIGKYLIGDSYFKNKTWDSAFDCLNDCKEAGEYMLMTDSERLYRLGICRGKVYDHEESINYLNEAIREDDEDTRAHNRLGLEYLQVSDYKNALKHYSRCLEIDPDNIKAKNNIVRAYIGLGMLDELKQYVENSTGSFWADTYRRIDKALSSEALSEDDSMDADEE